MRSYVQTLVNNQLNARCEQSTLIQDWQDEVRQDVIGQLLEEWHNKALDNTTEQQVQGLVNRSDILNTLRNELERQAYPTLFLQQEVQWLRQRVEQLEAPLSHVSTVPQTLFAQRNTLQANPNALHLERPVVQPR